MNNKRESTLQMIDCIWQLANLITAQLRIDYSDGNKTDFNSVETVVAMLHKRIHSNLIAIRYFVADEKNLSLTSPAILFRAISLDYMILLYLNIKRKEFEHSYKWKEPISQDLQDQIDLILNEQLVKLYQDSKKMIGIDFKNKSEYDIWVSEVKKIFPARYHFIDETTKLKSLKSVDFFNALKNNPKKDKFDKYTQGTYSFYIKYSKIDHFGIVSIALEKQTLDSFLKELRSGLIFVHHAFSLIAIDFMQLESLSQCISNISNELEKIISTEM